MHGRHSKHKEKLDSGKARAFSTNQNGCAQGFWAHSTYYTFSNRPFDVLIGKNVFILKAFCFRLLKMAAWNHGTFFLAQSLPIIISLSDRVQNGKRVQVLLLQHPALLTL